MLHFGMQNLCMKLFIFTTNREEAASAPEISSSATDEEEEVLPSKCFDVAASSSGGDSFKVCSLNLCKFYSKNVY